MQRKIPVTLCEIEFAKGVEVPGQTYVVRVDNLTVELDLCDKHRGQYVDRLEALMREAGRKVKQSARAVPKARAALPDAPAKGAKAPKKRAASTRAKRPAEA